MQKRVFCALWMAFFANVAAFPLWIFILKSGARASFPFTFVLILAVVGAVVGGLIQPFAIGRRSNALLAAIMGAFCAAVAVPLLMVGVLIMDSTPHLFSFDSLFSFAQKLPGGALRFIEAMWFIILPVGAIGGLTLQCTWRFVEETRPGGACRMPPGSEQQPLPREGE